MQVQLLFASAYQNTLSSLAFFYGMDDLVAVVSRLLDLSILPSVVHYGVRRSQRPSL